MNMQINLDELRRQREAHLARQARLGVMRRGVMTGAQHDANLVQWRRHLDRPWLRPERETGWPESAPGRGAPVPLVLSDPEDEGGVPPPRRILIRDIIGLCAEYYGVRVQEMLSIRRQGHLIRARHVAMYLAHVTTAHSLPEIGAAFAGRDHTTVLHAVRKMRRLIECDPALAAEVEALRIRITGGDDAHA